MFLKKDVTANERGEVCNWLTKVTYDKLQNFLVANPETYEVEFLSPATSQNLQRPVWTWSETCIFCFLFPMYLDRASSGYIAPTGKACCHLMIQLLILWTLDWSYSSNPEAKP